MSAFQKVLLPVLVIFTSLLTSCGGGSGGGSVAGIGGTGQIASGTITGFGSIFVNGIEFFDIDSATCVIDDNDSTGNCQANLQLGMVVKITGTNDGSTGNATQIIYNDDIDGPISGLVALIPGNVTRTFTVLGTTVLIDSASTAFAGSKGFSDLADTDLVEVSGFFDNNGVLNATFVKYQGSLQFGSTMTELKGSVTATTPTSGATSTGDTFVVNGITITLLSSTDLSAMNGSVSTGNIVDVRGTLNAATAIDADRVKPEDDMIGNEGDDVSIEGLVTGFINTGNFRVNGQQVDASAATLSPGNLQLANGIKVEVEGNITGGTLVAGRVESRGNDIKINATVFSKDATANTVTLQFGNGNTLTVLLNNQTQTEDKMGGAMTGLNLTGIQPGDYLEIRGFLNTDPAVPVVASELRRNTLDNDLLQGPVDSAVTNVSVTILGMTFTSDGNTEFEVNDAGSTSTNFYNTVNPGCIVKIQDGENPTTPPDGVADEMDLEGSCP